MSVTRRKFHQSVVAAAGALVPHVAFGETEQAATGYVDVHVHLGQPWNELGPLTAEMMLRWMDAHQIQQAFVLSLISPESWSYPITPQWILEQTRPYRDRLIPFCAVDPRSVNLGGYKGFLDILKRYQDAGCRGMGEHKWGGAMDDPRNIELLRACGDVGFPVLFHLDNLRNTDAPGLPGLEKVLQTVPNVKLIGHAPGWWASISGDANEEDMARYPRRPVTAGGAMDRLMDKYPNIYADLSAGSGANAIQRDLEFGREFLIRRSDRILFGSDYLATGQDVPQFELLEKIELPAEDREKIYRTNALRLLQADQQRESPPQDCDGSASDHEKSQEAD